MNIDEVTRSGLWLRAGFVLLSVGFAALAPFTAAALGGSGPVIAGSVPVGWTVGLIATQVVARIDTNIAAIRGLGPSAVLALPLGGLILSLIGVLLMLVGIEL